MLYLLIITYCLGAYLSMRVAYKAKGSIYGDCAFNFVLNTLIVFVIWWLITGSAAAYIGFKTLRKLLS